MRFKHLAAAGCAALAAACSALPDRERLPATPLVLTVQPGKAGEECFALAAGERIEYQFAATVALDFNLHAHRGREIVMPVKIDQAREQMGTFAAPQRDDYCMMWANKGAVPAYVKGEWRRLR
ncbi:MAG: hypothetical protein IPO58_20310 [Betaproteobacteria bacterium]|nr:hypothetical protein [Betaproteobacteria bacterium]